MALTKVKGSVIDQYRAFDTVAEAIAANIAIGQRVVISGYNALGDMPEKICQVVAGGTGTDDGGEYHDMDNGNQLKLVIPKGSMVLANWWGVLEGNSNNATQMQAAHDAGYPIAYMPGNYTCDTATAIIVSVGQIIYSVSGRRFSQDTTKRTVTITNNTAGGGIFHYTGDTGTAQKQAPEIYNFDLKADYPIKMNDRTGDITDGGPQPYLMQPVIKGCSIRPRIAGTGYGIDLAKCFDGEIKENAIHSFDINLLLTGSDINDVKHNRMDSAYTANILEFAVGTFGSQNNISDNDLLAVQSTACHIRTNSRHIRLYNNYLENTSTLDGFIDMSSENMPNIFGGKTPAKIFSIDCTGNRLDGFSFATSFVYYVAPEGVFHRVIDVGTTGNNFSGDVLQFAGDGYLPVRFNIIHQPYYEFKGPNFGKWSDFKSAKSLISAHGSLTVNAESFHALDSDSVNGNNAGDEMRLDANGVVLTPSFATTSQWYPPSPGPDGLNNAHFKNGVTYNVKVVARSSVSGDNIRLGRYDSAGSSALTNYPLTDQSTEINFTIAGDTSASTIGIYMARTGTGYIKIESVTWSAV